MILSRKLSIVTGKFQAAWGRARSGLGIARLGLVLSAVMMMAASSAVRADVLQIAGVGFTSHSEFDVSPGVGYQGVLRDLSDKYYAPVPFPRHRNTVCKFTVIYRDNAGPDLTATLYRKNYQVGTSTAYSSPIVMGQVQSTNVQDTLTREMTTTNISKPVINLKKAFYFVKLDVGCCPAQDIQIIGVRIEHTAGTCP